MIRALKKIFACHSPSELFIAFTKDCNEYFVKGFQEGMVMKPTEKELEQVLRDD